MSHISLPKGIVGWGGLALLVVFGAAILLGVVGPLSHRTPADALPSPTATSGKPDAATLPHAASTSDPRAALPVVENTAYPVSPVSPAATMPALTETPAQGTRQYGLSSISFIDAVHGWAISQDCDKAGHCRILATRDGGETWQSLSSSSAGVLDIRFTSPTTGWLDGAGLYKSTDGGASWRDVGLKGNIYLGDVTNGVITVGQQSCGQSTPEAWAGCPSKLLESSDEGVNWHVPSWVAGVPGQPGLRLQLSNHTQLISFSTGSDSRSQQAHLLASHDNGKTWQPLPAPPCNSYEEGSLLNPQNGELWNLCLVQPTVPMYLYVSSDGGLSWHLRAAAGGWAAIRAVGQLPTGGYLHSVALSSPGVVWLSMQRNGLYGSRDGGRTWTEAVQTDDELSAGDVVFADELHGWFVAGIELFRTVDGGKTWEKLPRP